VARRLGGEPGVEAFGVDQVDGTRGLAAIGLNQWGKIRHGHDLGAQGRHA
jgi:hypothetical protein